MGALSEAPTPISLSPMDRHRDVLAAAGRIASALERTDEVRLLRDSVHDADKRISLLQGEVVALTSTLQSDVTTLRADVRDMSDGLSSLGEAVRAMADAQKEATVRADERAKQTTAMRKEAEDAALVATQRITRVKDILQITLAVVAALGGWLAGHWLH